ncbi:response regulator [Spongisporangium articulatum]|uniref:Response regulator n=1 Tax=Spongisporangium articulatum TaxID=3362603 RepID=A0ABW8AHM6_9ACTN
MAQILMVDDDPSVLSGYRRALHGRFEIATAGSGEQGLDAVRAAAARGEPFAVVVSDMKMPQMDGAQFLGAVRALEPDAVQLLLSGQADLESTIAAVNDGNLFRMLTKPCAADDLAQALSAALEQHRLLRAERDLLESTLGGAVEVLTELLSMANPDAFAWTQRLRTLVERVAELLEIEDWRLPLAAMLSQIGCLAVPPEVLRRGRTGAGLSPEEQAAYDARRDVAQHLLERIPRLEQVAAWVGGRGSDEPAARLLETVLAYLEQLDRLGSPTRALRRLETIGGYPPEVLEALDEAAVDLAQQGERRVLPLAAVRPGMVLEDDVLTSTGLTLVRRGDRITDAVVLRLENFAASVGVVEPIVVRLGI